MQSIWSPRLLLKRFKIAQRVLAHPRAAEFREVLRAEIQSTPDLFNFNRQHPLADMYRSERRASALNAGSGFVASGLSVMFPPAALAMPVLPYLGYKAARAFRPAALIVGSTLGFAGGIAHHHHQKAHEPPPHTPTIMPEHPQAPIQERERQIVILARAVQAQPPQAS